MPQRALQSVVPRRERQITIEMIQKAVSEAFGLEPGRLKEQSRTETISQPRQIAMYLARELTGSSLPKIGRAFGGMHHTTVLHAARKIENMRRTDPDLNRLIHRLSDWLYEG